MYPVLLSVGPLVVSSFGVFLGAGFLAAVFVAWRVARAYDIDEEKMFDLTAISLFAGLIGARLLFVLINWPMFDSPAKMILFNRYPGLSFWGGLIGGGLAVFLLCRRFKFNFWQIADFAAVSLAIGAVFGEIGCLLGGCGYGLPSDLPWAVAVTGVIGKRLPLPLLESTIFFLIFIYLWGQVLRFHFSGKIVSLMLILLGAEKLGADFYRGDRTLLPFGGLSVNQLLAAAFLVIGTAVYYVRAKRSPKEDLTSLWEMLVSPKKQKKALFRLQKSWYNQKVVWQLRVQGWSGGFKKVPGSLKRVLNVKSTPKNFN